MITFALKTINHFCVVFKGSAWTGEMHIRFKRSVSLSLSVLGLWTLVVYEGPYMRFFYLFLLSEMTQNSVNTLLMILEKQKWKAKNLPEWSLIYY